MEVLLNLRLTTFFSLFVLHSLSRTLVALSCFLSLAACHTLLTLTWSPDSIGNERERERGIRGLRNRRYLLPRKLRGFGEWHAELCSTIRGIGEALYSE